ncbi:AraC family ligand binding domain-containing protein [Enterobacter mori]
MHHYGRHPDAKEWYHQWVYFRPRAYWQEWLSVARHYPAFIGRMRAHLSQFRELFARLLRRDRRADATPNCWRLTCLNRCCCAGWKRSMNRLTRRWITASATPASTSAIIWPTASLILPASPSTFACRLRACRICSASSLA